MSLMSAKPSFQASLYDHFYYMYLEQYLTSNISAVALQAIHGINSISGASLANITVAATVYAKVASKGVANAVYDFVKKNLEISTTGPYPIIAPPNPTGPPFTGGPVTGTIGAKKITIM